MQMTDTQETGGEQTTAVRGTAPLLRAAFGPIRAELGPCAPCRVRAGAHRRASPEDVAAGAEAS